MELTSIEGQANKRPLVYYAVNEAYLPYALASCLNAQRTATRTDVDYAILAPSCDRVRKVKGTAERHNIKLFEITTDKQACSFNSGVVLFNYSEATSFRLFDKALSMVRTHPDRPNEQEALTVSVSGRIKRIEPIYNFVARPGVESIGEKMRHFAYVHKPWLLVKNGLVNTTRDAAIYRNLLGELGLSEYMDIPLKKGYRSIFKRLKKKLATFLYKKRYKRGKLQRR